MKNTLKITTIAVAFAVVALFPRQAAAYTNEDMGFALESFGVAFGLAVYNTQMVIGLSADSLEAALYPDEQIKHFVDEQLSTLNVLRETVIKVQKAGIASNEESVLNDMLYTIDRLKETANALNGYIANPTNENADYFQTMREASYNSVANLLGLKSE